MIITIQKAATWFAAVIQSLAKLECVCTFIQVLVYVLFGLVFKSHYYLFATDNSSEINDAFLPMLITKFLGLWNNPKYLSAPEKIATEIRKERQNLGKRWKSVQNMFVSSFVIASQGGFYGQYLF